MSLEDKRYVVCVGRYCGVGLVKGRHQFVYVGEKERDVEGNIIFTGSCEGLLLPDSVHDQFNPVKYLLGTEYQGYWGLEQGRDWAKYNVKFLGFEIDQTQHEKFKKDYDRRVREMADSKITKKHNCRYVAYKVVSEFLGEGREVSRSIFNGRKLFDSSDLTQIGFSMRVGKKFTLTFSSEASLMPIIPDRCEVKFPEKFSYMQENLDYVHKNICRLAQDFLAGKSSRRHADELRQSCQLYEGFTEAFNQQSTTFQVPSVADFMDKETRDSVERLADCYKSYCYRVNLEKSLENKQSEGNNTDVALEQQFLVACSRLEASIAKESNSQKKEAAETILASVKELHEFDLRKTFSARDYPKENTKLLLRAVTVPVTGSFDEDLIPKIEEKGTAWDRLKKAIINLLKIFKSKTKKEEHEEKQRSTIQTKRQLLARSVSGIFTPKKLPPSSSRSPVKASTQDDEPLVMDRRLRSPI